jgi:hypothetical protein
MDGISGACMLLFSLSFVFIRNMTTSTNNFGLISEYEKMNINRHKLYVLRTLKYLCILLLTESFFKTHFD